MLNVKKTWHLILLKAPVRAAANVSAVHLVPGSPDLIFNDKKHQFVQKNTHKSWITGQFPQCMIFCGHSKQGKGSPSLLSWAQLLLNSHWLTARQSPILHLTAIGLQNSVSMHGNWKNNVLCKKLTTNKCRVKVQYFPLKSDGVELQSWRSTSAPISVL